MPKRSIRKTIKRLSRINNQKKPKDSSEARCSGPKIVKRISKVDADFSSSCSSCTSGETLYSTSDSRDSSAENFIPNSEDEKFIDDDNENGIDSKVAFAELDRCFRKSRRIKNRKTWRK